MWHQNNQRGTGSYRGHPPQVAWSLRTILTLKRTRNAREFTDFTLLAWFSLLSDTGLVAVNDAPTPAGEDRVGKWSASMKVRGNAQYLPPHILMSEKTWAKVLDTNPIGMWFGTNKNDLSLIRVTKIY